MTTGRIFDIQRYSIHDGGGIRTIVFFKGCFLRCRWCCNPESQEREIQTMTIGGKPKVMGRDVTVAEVMEIVERDRTYYRRSGGGLTLSGGEILAQPAFACDLLHAAKDIGLHTAIESTAFAAYEIIADLLPFLDMFLLDIKHIDPDKHKAFTGQSNALILENARKIADSHLTELIVRVPVVPGFNSSVEDVRNIATFAASLNGVEEINLLPYHRLGQGKYAALGREYALKDILPPEDQIMEELKSVVEKSTRLRCRIGG
jgi:pyruvate formate lyase activating enzyme